MTEAHKRFADHYFKTLKGAESAIEAGFSPDTAKQQAWQILQRPDVQEYLEYLREDMAKKHGITLDNWLSELKEVGFSNIQDFLDKGNTIADISMTNRDKARAVASVKKTVRESEFGTTTTTELKLHAKLNALETIGRHMGFFEKDNEQKKEGAAVVIFKLPDNGRMVNPETPDSTDDANG